MCAASRPQDSSLPPWTEQSQSLCTAWLKRFSEAVQAVSGDGIKKLFHQFAVVFGGEKHGPCDDFDALHFYFVGNKAKIAPLDPAYCLVTVEWRVSSPIVGAAPKVGNATFVLYIEYPVYAEDKVAKQGSVTCVHAHFSRVK